MKKVLFFDSWKGGINHFIRLVPELERRGFTCLLIHLGSWGNEKRTVAEETVNGLLVRDISYYKGLDFYEIIIREKPCLVLFLSCHTFAHRAFNRLCHYHQVPTINLYHGLVRVQAVDDGKGPYKVSWRAYLKFTLSRLPKVVLRTIPAYMRALRITKAPLKEWKTFIRNIVEVFTKPSTLRVASDARTSICLVYADTDKIHAIQTYGFKTNQVKSVGNPDLISFGLRAEHIASWTARDAKSFSDVIYIDTALTATGLIVKSQAEYITHIRETGQSLNAQGKRLLLKPHPETLRLYGASVFCEAGVSIINNNEFVERLKTCHGVIAETSTLALIPALMGIPLFLAKYGKLRELEFGEVLISYPNSVYLSDIDKFSSLWDSLNLESKDELDFWIRANSGPLPAEAMPERVVDTIGEIISCGQAETI